jgi:hypothetical protein
MRSCRAIVRTFPGQAIVTATLAVAIGVFFNCLAYPHRSIAPATQGAIIIGHALSVVFLAAMEQKDTQTDEN